MKFDRAKIIDPQKRQAFVHTEESGRFSITATIAGIEIGGFSPVLSCMEDLQEFARAIDSAYRDHIRMFTAAKKQLELKI